MDHDLAGLGHVELAAGLVPLAEEVADEPLGGLIQGVEVGGELGVDTPAKIKNQSRPDLSTALMKKE